MYDLPEPGELELQKYWIRRVTKLLHSFRSYRMDKLLFFELMRENRKFDLYHLYGIQLGQDIVNCFQSGITQQNRRDVMDFMKFVKKMFFTMAEYQKLKFTKIFIDEWQHYELDHCPYFEKITENFNKNLEQMILKMMEDPENVEDSVKEEIRYSMLISSVSTLLRLFHYCTLSPSLIPRMIEICESIPDLFKNRKFRIYHNDYEVDRRESVLAVAFRRFIFHCRCHPTGISQWDGILQLAISICTGKEKEPLMDPSIMLDLVFDELYTKNRRPIKSVEILAAISAEILKSCELENSEFSRSKRDQPRGNLFLTPSIIDLHLTLFKEFQDSSSKICEHLKTNLKFFGRQMRMKGAELDEETQEEILERIAKCEFPWCFEYSLQKWFGIGKPKLPSTIFQNLPEADQEHFQEIPVENLKSTFISDIFKLGLFDLELVMQFWNLDCYKISSISEFLEICEKSILEAFSEMRGFAGRAEARILIQKIFEKFAQSDESEIKYFVDSLLQEIPHFTPTVDEEMKYASVMMKSEIIQSLDQPITNRSVWPETHMSFRPVDLKEIRRQQEIRKRQDQELARKRNQEMEELYQRQFERENVLGKVEKNWNISIDDEPVFESPIVKPKCTPRLGGFARRGGRH